MYKHVWYHENHDPTGETCNSKLTYETDACTTEELYKEFDYYLQGCGFSVPGEEPGGSAEEDRQRALRAALEAGCDAPDIDLSKCPGCGGPADNGNSRDVPPAPYYCTKCDPQSVNPGKVDLKEDVPARHLDVEDDGYTTEHVTSTSLYEGKTINRGEYDG